MYLLPRRPIPQPMPNEIQAQTGFVPQPMPDITPQPPKLNRYLGTRPNAEVQAATRFLPPPPIATPATPGSVALGDMPNQAANVPLPMPAIENAPTPMGRILTPTQSRNASGISAPMPTPQQSDDIDGLSNTPKYVRGSEPTEGGYLGTRPTLDPMSQARNEVGDLKKLGFWGRLGQIGKGALLGLASSGGGDLGQALGGALGGAIGGGMDVLRRGQQQAQIQQRAGEIAAQNQYERQAQQDELGRRQIETNLKNIETDNRLKEEAQAETKRNNLEKTRVAEERNNLNRMIANGKLEVSQVNALNNIARNLKGTGVELPDEVADALKLPRGTVLQDNPQNPSRYSVLRLRDGRILNYDKTTGQLANTGEQDIPVQNAAQTNAQAKLNALNGVQTNANGQVDNPAALRYLQSLDIAPDDPQAELLLQDAKIPRYLDPTKTEAFRQGVIRETAKGTGYLGNRPATTQLPQVQPPNAAPTQQTPQRKYTPQDLEMYKKIRNNPNARQSFINKFGVDPDTL